MVYELLGDHGLSAYYEYTDRPGISKKKGGAQAFDYLDSEDLVGSLLSFRESGVAKISLQLPQIHCSSCLFLLENIAKLDKGIVQSRVNFTTKEAIITYREADTSLRAVVELLARIGYEPKINYDQLDKDTGKHDYDKKLLYKLGLAGFCFGNIMLLSFPEYLGFDKASYLFHIGYINIVLAIPVLFYSGFSYIRSAWQGIRYGNLNIDVPIALGMVTLFARSLYEILSQTGEGYLDSFAGFVFFLLIGRWFQSFTYHALDFDRNYKSYFPISATVKAAGVWTTKAIDQLLPGDILRIRNEELIPTDAILQKGKARVDYSFVTGEADLISKQVGDSLYAGGRHMGESIEVVVTHKVDQSYLTQLWNEDTFKDRGPSDTSQLIGSISKYFTYVVLAIAAATMTYWYLTDPTRAFQTFTAVLIVACPCALALAIPFTYGNIVRLLSRGGLYLRNVGTIEDIQDVTHIIFDKTGTITDSSKVDISYSGKELTEQQRIFIKSACSHSSHPLSKAIVGYLVMDSTVDIDKYEDIIGSGFRAEWQGSQLRLGSSAFVFGTSAQRKERGVFIEIEGQYLGYFSFEHQLREHLQAVIGGLQQRYTLSVLSGDTDGERARIEEVFGSDSDIRFNQKPKDKLQRIKELQATGAKVMMIGDGLNDAGALKQSNVGIVISDKVNNFSPACDGMLSAEQFATLLRQLKYLSAARHIIYGAFGLAFLYNTIGLYFAVTGQMSPVIAAILMPVSSITVIVYGVVASYLAYQRYMK